MQPPREAGQRVSPSNGCEPRNDGIAGMGAWRRLLGCPLTDEPINYGIFLAALCLCGMKRLLDIFGASAGLLLGAPILLLIAVLVRITIGPPVLFLQPRAGLHGRQFMLVKFRTMRDVREADGRLAADRDRLTSLGRILRATSTDELPGLWNVLKGDMSIVGPRPLLMEYLPLYSREQARRHTVRPGITGWAQVNGRNAISWDEKFKLDVWYVDNHTLLLDLKILLMTARAVLWRDGISAEGEATMPRFQGNPSQRNEA